MAATTKRTSLAEQFIQNRRATERKENDLNAYLKTDKISRHVAGWEIKGREDEHKKFVDKKMGDYTNMMENQIEARRLKLKQLYDTEEKVWEDEIRKLRLTNEQIKQGMIERVEELKKKREAARTSDVEARLERRFREGEDSLRKIESSIKENLIANDLELQVMEKHKKMERDFDEEMFYAALWDRDRKNKETAERLKEEHKKKINDNRNHILGLQAQDLKDFKENEKAEKLKEQEMLKEQWAQENNGQKDKEAEEAALYRRLNADIREQNNLYKKMKDDEAALIKELDKKMVLDKIEQEKILDQLDLEKKQAYAEETRKFLLNFKNRADEAKQNQDLLDNLLQQEVDKQYMKQKEQWDREEAARIKLMHEVYDDRANSLYLREDQRKKELLDKENEKVQLSHKVEEYLESEKRTELGDIMKNKQYQNCLLWQINDKNERRRKELLEGIQDERQRRLEKLNLETRIKHEKELGNKRVMEAKLANSRYC